jgi:transcriptional/translational regulatory protein YebC/TACO1
MAGQNKWSKVKRSKGAIDAERGKFFSRLSRKIAVVAKFGGPDSDANARLRSPVSPAQNMTNNKSKRTITPDDIDNMFKLSSDFELPAEVLERISGQN